MAAHLVTFHPDTDIHEAIKVLVQHRISGAPVI
ncbi:MAG: CBS domain-containing protein, partial [Candidatus Methylomirabilales bacterium]